MATAAPQFVLDPGAPGGDSTAIRYVVSGRAGFALLFIHARVIGAGDGERERTRIEIAATGDWGPFGHVWTHASGDWREWLADLEFHYGMNKLAGCRFMAPMDVEAAKQKAREVIRNLRERQAMSREDGHTLRSALREEFEWGPGGFLRELDDKTAGLMSRYTIWDWSFQEPSRDCRGFWEHVWTPFAAYLKSELRAEQGGLANDGTGTADGPANFARTEPFGCQPATFSNGSRQRSKPMTFKTRIALAVIAILFIVGGIALGDPSYQEQVARELGQVR
ncbi:hypothetical protein LWE61_15135 [Sphingobium sufflavum]|uniref:hypothetical protein n=1 Tax=Sphingobium sufflavum TaxID=1129547 RepID=UPI001F295422|nr:hypothetical protein [Sphingobium sufflavum]MCE7797883.1 hypothetical protein [Sphingobium sufflavum]